jgi:hypothetical protein
VDLLSTFQTLESQVADIANGLGQSVLRRNVPTTSSTINQLFLDGSDDPTGILLDIEACLKVAIDIVLDIDLDVHVQADVNAIVDLTAQTFTVRFLSRYSLSSDNWN